MTDDRTAEVLLTGDLDIHNCESVSSALPQPGTVDRVVVDCSGVTSIDSSVVTVLMRYRRAFAAAGGDPLNIVFIASRQARRIFEITGLVRCMTVINAPEESQPVS